MKTPTPILTGQLDSLVWIRPEGRGTFIESSLVENFVKAAVESGRIDFVVDLEACLGMDSTFMGMLAGLGINFQKKGEGTLTILGTSEKTKASLLELGLHYLSRIEPSEGPWVGRLEEIRTGLIPIVGECEVNKEDHVLHCHENLCMTDSKNFDRFKTVLDMLGSEMTKAPTDTLDQAH